MEDIETIIQKETWTAEDHAELYRMLLAAGNAPKKFKAICAQLEAESPEIKGAAALKIGMARYMLCQFDQAVEAFNAATDNKDRRYFQALCYKYLRDYDKAAEEFQRAQDRGWDAEQIAVELVELMILSGDLAAAEKALVKLESKRSECTDTLYLRGFLEELSGRGQAACEAYEKVRQRNAQDVRATFRLAYYYDLHGEEARAIELYRQCLSHPPIHANALLNLAVLYDDAGRYALAAHCLRSILATHPNHPRARLFLRDVESSKTMYYDEDQAKRIARRNAVLDIPVTDFELSVRARNCLKKMNIRTLGDLVNITEIELLSYKNFGETSLKEIKDMLSAKNLHLGQALEEGSELADSAHKEADKPSQEQGILATPLERIEFSVRARRALDGLGMKTLGELVSKSEAELLSCRNFGQTSLNEIRQRLGEYGVQLRGSD